MFSEKELSNTIRMLSIDAIEKSQSGHPGMPMGMADIATVLWREFLKHNPKNPNWYDRDRFILSNGHGSMLLYSVLHLTGYDLTIKDIKKFRQYKSKTPGHPEIECTPGVEVTTGPLGQGLANAVGMAISEKILSAYFNRPTLIIVDHYTWVFMGDGCLMEGISHESCSLAGTLGLGKLIGFYDKNNISIDGEVNEWFTDNTYKRFKSYNWHVISDVDGHDFNSIRDAIKESKSIKDKPSLIICKTIIGYGSPNKSGLKDSHGSPLGSQEVSLVRKNLKWNYSPFKVSKNIYKHWSFIEQGEVLEKKWLIKFKKYQKKYPKLSKEYIRRMSSKIPTEWNSIFKNLLSKININRNNISTRQASQIVLERLGKIFPELIGGSADLAPSNLTQWSGSKSIKSNFVGNYIHYGVREFGMSAIANGIFHHGGFIPYTATFLMFFEYAHNAIRMAALMNTKHIFIYTHDSIGLGEDGPTHQPIEQLSILRLIPNLHVWRPANIIETAVSWKIALERKKGPSALILSRQNLPSLSEVKICFKDVSKGGYIFKDFGQSPQIIFIATGSELHLAFKAAEIIYNRGYCVRVVSMPNTNIFDNQDSSYKDFVLPTHVTKRIVVEAGIIDFWYKYVGKEGLIIGMNQFGESAPAEQLLQIFGFTVSNIVKKALTLIV